VGIQLLKRIVPGQSTPAFARYTATHGHLRDRSLSIHFTNDKGKEHSLNITADSLEDYNYILAALNELMEKDRKERISVSPDLSYLRDMWERG
jgi:hypothetical protein